MALVVPPNNAGVPVPPPPPNNPPTALDIFEARTYERRLQKSHGSNSAILRATQTEVAAAANFTHCVISAQAGQAGAPAWFNAAINAAVVNAVNNTVPQAVNAAVAAAVTPAVNAAMNVALAPINARLDRIERNLAVVYNATCGSGDINNFQIVLFANGDDPVGLHNLPALISVNVIHALTNGQIHAYCQGYGLGGNTYDHRRQLIASHIGCRTALF